MPGLFGSLDEILEVPDVLASVHLCLLDYLLEGTNLGDIGFDKIVRGIFQPFLKAITRTLS